MRRLFLKMTSAAALGALVGACGGTDDGDDVTPGTMIDVAARSGEISALVPAAERAGLDDELSADNANLTVFAPTNEAWALLSGQLGFSTIQELIDGLPLDVLQSILLYHTLPTQLSKADLLAGGPSQDTLLVQAGNTISLPLNTANNGVRITDSVGRLAITNLFDIPADNGAIHVIDRVLIPSGVLSVLQTIQSNPERFEDLVNTALGLPSANPPAPNAVVTALSGPAVTLFAPVNEAFDDIAQVLPTLSNAQKTTVLLHHVLDSTVLSGAIPFTPITTEAGQDITITAGGTAIATIDDSTTTDANITQVDIIATNGVVHVIDKVLLPTP